MGRFTVFIPVLCGCALVSGVGAATLWSEDFEGAAIGASSSANSVLPGTTVASKNSQVLEVANAPAGWTGNASKVAKVSSAGNAFEAIVPSALIEFAAIPTNTAFTLSFDLYIPATLAVAVGDIQPRFKLAAAGGNGSTDSSHAKSLPGIYHVVYSGTVGEFTSGLVQVDEAFPFLGFDQGGATVSDFAYIDNIHFDVGGATPPSNDAWFATLRTTRVASDPTVRWRQFGPGMSGNNYRIYWHPTDPDIAFLGPNMGNVYRTIDRGTTYESPVDCDDDGYAFDTRGPIEIQSPDFSRQDPDFGFCSREAESKLYKTTDRGKTWTWLASLDSVWGGKRMNTIAVDPSNDNIWFVGSGDLNDRNNYFFTAAQPHGYGTATGHAARIWKSSNKGASWSNVTPAGITANACIIRIIVHPSNSSIVWAATTYGLYKSTNGGTSWTAKTGTGLDHDIIRSFDMHYDPASSKVTLFAIDLVEWADAGNTVVNDGGGVFRSDDLGESWTKINGDLGVNVSVLNSDYQFKTTYWSMLNNWFGISDASTRYTVYPTSLMHAFTEVRVDPSNVNKIFLVNDYKHYGGWTTMRGGMLWRTDNGGSHWFATARNGTAWEGTHKSYWQGRGNPTVHNMFLRGQKKWEQRESYERKAGAVLEFNADATVIMFQWAKTLCLSYDGGDTWEEVDEIETIPGSEIWVAAENSNLPGHGLVQDPRFPNTIFMPCGENDFWVLEPGGDSVRSGYQAARRVEMGTDEYSCSSIAIHPANTNTIYTLQFRQKSAGDLLRSTNGGLNFQEIGVALPWPAGVSENNGIDQLCLTINPGDPNYMFFCIPRDAAVHGFTWDPGLSPTTGVRRTTNGGLNWDWANTGLPASRDVPCVRLDPNNSTHLYACVYGSGGGLYMSTNNAASWFKYTALPSNIYSVSDIHFSGDGKIYVSCGYHGDSDYANGGVWVSDDDGASWTQLFKTVWARMAKTAAYDPDVILVQMNSKNTVAIKNPGTYLSKDGGATWAKINTGNLQSDRVNDIAIDQVVSNRYYVSTQGCGWLRADLVDTSNVAPAFAHSPVVRSNAVPVETYAGTIDGEASDSNGDSIDYSLVFGPSWLSVAADGTLSGTPPADALGTYLCQVQADDGVGMSSRAIMNFIVSTNPAAYYASWLRGYPGTGGLDGYADDPDNDFLVNLEEYAFGGNPAAPDSPEEIRPTFRATGSGFDYVYRRRMDAATRGIGYRLQSTTNLVSGPWLDNGYAVAGIGAGAASMESVTNAVPADDPSRYFRLKVELQ